MKEGPQAKRVGRALPIEDPAHVERGSQSPRNAVRTVGPEEDGANAGEAGEAGGSLIRQDLSVHLDAVCSAEEETGLFWGKRGSCASHDGGHLTQTYSLPWM